MSFPYATNLYAVRGQLTRCRPGGAAAGDVPGLLSEAHGFLDRIELERNRIAAELDQLLAAQVAEGVVGAVLSPAASLIFGPLDLLGLQTRRDSFVELIRQLELFVTDVFNVIEQKALAGDAAAALRLRDAAARILGVAQTATPKRDLADDAKATVKNTLDDLKSTLEKIAKLAGFALAALVVIKLLQLLKG